MDAQQVLTLLISAVLSVGFGAAITTIFTSRASVRKIGAEARALESKTPAEIDSITVQGAEKAVLMLQTTNETLISENERLYRENTHLHETILELEAKLESYRHNVQTAEAALVAARREYEALRDDFDRLRRSVDSAE